MKHEIMWEERENHVISCLEKCTWKEININFEVDVWEDVNCPHNGRREGCA